MTKAWFGAGWPYVARDLEGFGTRYIISPYVTSAALQFGLRAGDRLLLQGTARNFLQQASNFEVIEELVKGGIEVRRETRVHAKVYMRQFEGSAVGWLGSANLTQNGRSSGAQIEAMSGPFWLDKDFLEETEQLWISAKPFDLHQVQREIRDLEEQLLSSGLPEDAMQALIAVHITFNAGLGKCTLRSEWLGIDVQGSSWRGVTFPTVPHFRPETVSKYKAWKDQGVNKLVSNGGYALGDGIYLFRASLKNQIETQLNALRQHLFQQAQHEFRDVGALRQDFTQRLSEVLLEFASKESLELTDEKRRKGFEEAGKQFDSYMAGNPFRLSFSFFVPMMGGEDERLSAAARQLLSQPYQTTLPFQND